MNTKIKEILESNKKINAPLNSIFNSCIELTDGVNKSTLNPLEKIAATKIIDDIYNNCTKILRSHNFICGCC